MFAISTQTTRNSAAKASTKAAALAFALTSLLAAPAFAESPLAGVFGTVPAATATTRSQVQAELATFRTGPNPWSISYNALAASPSELTRQTVKAEVRLEHAAHAGINTNGDNFDVTLVVAAPVQAKASVAALRGAAPVL